MRNKSEVVSKEGESVRWVRLPISGLLIFLVALLLFSHPSFLRAQWVQTNGPDSGTVQCIATSNSSLFAGSEVGIFVSTDTHELGVLGNVLFAGSTVYGGNLYERAGLFRSIDGGNSWQEIATKLPVIIGLPYFNSIAVKGKTVFVATNDGLVVVER